jgi:hypothetical protein
MAVQPKVDQDGLVVGKPEYLEFVVEGVEFDVYKQLWWHKVEEYYKQLI